MNASLAKPRAILFDWDNTLVDTWPLIHMAMNMTLEHMGHEIWSMEKVLSEVKLSMRESFPTLFGERWKEAGEFYTKSYRSINLQNLKALTGAEAMLATIPRPSVFTGVVSNKQGVTLRLEVPALKWEKYFNVLVGASDAERDKPHADPALLALKNSGVEPGKSVWFVGDTGADLGCAQAGGFTAILFRDKEVAGDEFDGYPFHAHVRNNHELQELIAANS